MITQGDYTFRLATAEDQNDIIRFMDENWEGKHPLIHIPEFFEFYYRNAVGLNFALAQDKEGALQAICGFVPANVHYSSIWISLWLSKKGTTGAGLELMSLMDDLTKATVICCNNIRPNTIPFYDMLGFTATRLPHFYRLANKPLAEFKIARLKEVLIKDVFGDAPLTLITDPYQIESNFTVPKDHVPFKDNWYIQRRYFMYPMQDKMQYRVYGSYENGAIKALVVLREVDVEGTKVLRLVDYIGDFAFFAQLGKALDALLQESGAEYMDMYVYGLEDNILEAAGFIERVEGDINIIPNYLTPPLYENTEYYFFTNTTKNFTMFKADGDQDRPNMIIE
ncbi:MAG: hypothetical protein PHG02_01220 [Oscillospiraceae bacterium]|nr:hypothetical protein [Oscillospiraceae bacterium]